MNYLYPTDHEQATPEYVLAVLREWHRQDPDADHSVELSFDTPIVYWRGAFWETHTLWELGQALNRAWEMDCSDAEWRAVLRPEGTKKLGGVCELIARHTYRPRIRPARLLGRSCAAAGAFLTVRSLLYEAGVPVDNVRPSTALAPYTRQYRDVFLDPILRLAPGALPVARIHDPVRDAAQWCLVSGFLGSLAGSCFGWYLLATMTGFLLVAGLAVDWFAARCLAPRKVEFGELRTFRDLARALVSEAAP